MERGRLKYELCFLYYYKRAYEQREVLDINDANLASENNCSLEEQIKKRDDVIFKAVKKTFPYESDGSLRLIQEKILKNIKGGLNPSAAYKLIKNRFKDQLANISSSNLYHFTASAEYLLSALKNKVLHPTVVDFNEYFPNNKTYFILTDKTAAVPLRKLQESLDVLKDELNNSTSPLEETITKNKLPIFSCFTEMPEASLSFHAHHYGFWGISFNKEQMLWRREWEVVSNMPHSLCPVLYVGTTDNLIEDMLKANIKKGEDELNNWASLKELLKIKPILMDNLSHETIFSTYFEREWRYISSLRPFSFEYKDIESIFVSKELWDYHNSLRKFPENYEGNNHLSEIVNIAEKNGIRVRTIENMLLHRSGTLL